MLRAYQDRVAVVTGAAHGLGRALATELAARKCRVALIDSDPSALANVKQELAASAVAVTEHCVDVASQPALDRAASEIHRAHGAVHLLINNAAVSASASFASLASADFDRIIQVNFLGVVYGCRAFLPFLREHGEGQILNVASCFAWHGYPGKTAYAASKGAVRAFSESLRFELAATGIGVTLLYPGPLSTGIVRSGICDSDQRRALEEQFLQRHGLPLDRVARRCLDRLLRNPSRIVIGRDYRLLDALARLSPTLAEKVAALAAARLRF